MAASSIAPTLAAGFLLDLRAAGNGTPLRCDSNAEAEARQTGKIIRLQATEVRPRPCTGTASPPCPEWEVGSVDFPR
nr:hypothetical protein KPHV_14070 [Kitasatospora purpeofusca]